MKNRILDRLGLKLLSLVIAVIVWVSVANVDDYKTTKQIAGIEIEFINGDAIAEKNKVYQVPEGTTVNIVVKGRRKVVEDLTSDDFKAVADLSKMSITNAVQVEVSAVSSYIARELSISNANDAVVVAVEDKVEKQMPITVRALSEVAEGYAIRNRVAAPNLITVKGAESIINMIEDVVVDINVRDSNHNLIAYAEPIFLDNNGNVLDATKFEYDVRQVEVSVEILKTKELSIKVQTTGAPKDGYTISSIDYQPTSVLVVGEAEDLAKVDEIIIDDIDVTDCERNLETSIVIADYLPSGITIAENTEEVMIKVMVEAVEEKSITIGADDINIVGKADGYTYSYKSGMSYTLKVRGLKHDLDNLKPVNLIPSIDVNGYEPGTYTFTVSLKEITSVQILNTITVELEIKE